MHPATHHSARRGVFAVLLAVAAATVALLVPAHTAPAEGGILDDPAYMGISPAEADGGCGVGQVFRGSAADKAGLKAGDVLLSMDGKPTTNFSALRRVLRSYESGQNAALKVLRDGKEIDLSITFGARPANDNSIGSELKSATDPAEGTAVKDWTEQDFSRLPIPPGLPTLKDEQLQPLVSRAGTRVRWVNTLENAQLLAHATGRPIFWCFRKAPGTPTTESGDYEHYMRSTLFHYDSTTGIINRRFVPLYLNLTQAQARSYGIGRFSFYEPGFVIVSADLEKLHIVDRIMTFSEDFFVHTLARILEQVGRGSDDSVRLRKARQAAAEATAANKAAATLDLIENLVADGRANEALTVPMPANSPTDLVADAKLARAKAALQVRQREVAQQLIEQARDARPTAAMLALADLALRNNDLAGADSAAAGVLQSELATSAQKAHAISIAAEAAWRGKQESKAVSLWVRLGEEYPEEPYAWHAATCLIGKAALLFNNETRATLPANVFAGATPTGTGHPIDPADNTAAEDKLAARLLEFQRSTGQWSDTPYSFLGVQHRRNTVTAISATCALALTMHGGKDTAATKRALATADRFLLDAGTLSQTAIETVYAYLYSLIYFARTQQLRPEADRAKFAAVIQTLVDKLSEVSLNGQWGHEYTNPFCNGMALIALGEARRAGATVKQDVLKAGADSLSRVRSTDGAFPYDFSRGAARNGSAEGSAGRMPLCELGLLVAGQSHQKNLENALLVFFKYKGHLEQVRQYDYHADSFANGGFFFFHDMLGAALAIEQLENGRQRYLAATELRQMMLSYLEIDGTCMDSPNIGRSWGTGSTLVTLAILDQIIATTPEPTPQSGTPQDDPPGEDF